MQIPQLESALRSVPYLALLGVRVEEARPGKVVLRLPFMAKLHAHGSVLHSGAVYSLAETAASVAVATHPRLSARAPRQKSARIKYYAAAVRDVTAHAEVHAEQLGRLLDGASSEQSVSLDIVVRVLDARGEDIAEFTAHYALRGR